MSDFDPDYWGARIRAAAQVVPKGEAVMGEKMTLEQVRDWHLQRVLKLTSDTAAAEHYHMASAITAHITKPAQAVDVGAIASRLRVASDDAYCDYVRQLNATECLGWESKVSRGKFGRIELDAHNRAHELLGRHRALSEAVAILTAALPKDSNGAEVADGWRLIATAPKDGKEVLVAFTADGVRQVAEASWSDDEDAWVCSRDGFMLYRRNEPTHWMPLPDAPQEDTPDAAR